MAQQVAQRRQNHCHGVTVVAEWRHSGRHSDRSMDPINRPKEAQWWYKFGRQMCRSNWYTMLAFFTGRPMAILQPRQCVCLHSASFERPVSDRLPRRPLCDCFEHAQNFTATMASMAMSERPICHLWMTKATVRPPFYLERRPGPFCGHTREAQRSQPLCKGGISYDKSL